MFSKGILRHKMVVVGDKAQGGIMNKNPNYMGRH